MLDGRHRPRQGCYNGEANCNETGVVKGGLADPDHGSTSECARSIKPRIVEAGDHITVDIRGFTFADFRQQARNAECLIVVSLNGSRAVRWVDGCENGISASHRSSGGSDLAGHG